MNSVTMEERRYPSTHIYTGIAKVSLEQIFEYSYQIYLGFLVFDKALYEKAIRMKAHGHTMEDREDYEDGDINDPEQPGNNFHDDFNHPNPPSNNFDDSTEDINVEEELVQPMSQLQSQEETPRNSQQRSENSQQTVSRKSIRSQG